MSLWLLKSEMEPLKTSTDDVIIEATVPECAGEILYRRYTSGKTILFDVEVSFRNHRGEDVAKGIFHYYCKKDCSIGNLSWQAN